MRSLNLRIAAAAAMLLSGSAMAETYTPNAEFFAPRTFSFETTRGVTDAPTVWSAGIYQRYAGDGALGYFLYADQTMAVHPSSSGPSSVILKFTAPRAGSYRFTGAVSVVDQVNGTGIGVSWTGSSRRVVQRGEPAAAISTTIEMTAGQQFSIEVDSDGTSAYDTTGLSLSVEGPDAPRAWTTGAWSDWSSTCGQATRTRTVTCTDGETGSTLSDSSCAATPRPMSTETSTQTSGCTFAWEPGAWSAVMPACGQTVQTRSVECRRSDGTAAPDSSCAGTRPDDSRAVVDYSACTYGWQAGEWGTAPAACGTSTRTRTVACARSDGTEVPTDACDVSTMPASTEQVSDLSGCRYDWVQTASGDWSSCVDGRQTRSVSVQCRRSDGVVVADAQCDPSGRPGQDTRSCTSPVIVPPPVGGQPGAGGDAVIFRRGIPIAR